MLLSGTIPSTLKMCTDQRLCQIIVEVILFREKELSCFAEQISTPQQQHHVKVVTLGIQLEKTG